MAPVRSDAEIEAAIIAHGREPGGGLVVLGDAFTVTHRVPIILAPRSGLIMIGTEALMADKRTMTAEQEERRESVEPKPVSACVNAVT
jgi:hypothetical protein